MDSLNCSPLVTLCHRFPIMPSLEVKYVSTYTDAAGVALTVYRTELQVLEFDRSLSFSLNGKGCLTFLTSDGNSTMIKKRRFITF